MKKTLFVLVLFALAVSMTFAVNLISFGDMETGAISNWVEEGSKLSFKKGEGIDGSTALYVKGSYDWSGTGLDLTKIMKFDKSYYIEVWFKADKRDKDVRKGSITLELQPEGTDEWTQYIYLDVGVDYFEKQCTGSEVEFTNAGFTKVSGVFWSEDLQAAVDGKKIQHITVYFKIDSPLGRPYYIDNVVLEEIVEAQ
ncbi:MAG: carbohydrate binding domain-containing protein [Spirochaetales bacterium]|nr:carbohydrate binding domain-containing protein [Spirochaetales bacterium]